MHILNLNFAMACWAISL